MLALELVLQHCITLELVLARTLNMMSLSGFLVKRLAGTEKKAEWLVLNFIHKNNYYIYLFYDVVADTKTLTL